MRFFRKYHKWAGLILAVFLILFSISGIILNHRKVFSGIDLSRKLLPKDFHYNNWNNASVKGSMKLSADSVLLYGGNGIWLTDSLQNKISRFVDGLKSGADNQTVNRIIKTGDNEVYAVTTFDFYKLNPDSQWVNQTDKLGTNERISDMTWHNDTLVVITRSHLYYSLVPFTDFHRIEIAKPMGYEAKTSVFRTLWLLHSGKLFGIGGQIFVDMLGVLLIVVSVTGIIYFFSPKILKRRKKKELSIDRIRSTIKSSIKWHNKIGVVFLVFFLLLTLTGMFLRPPLMIAVIRSKISNPKGTVLDNDNPWYDKLRTIRYDRNEQHWLLYTSEGFYVLYNFQETPQRLTIVPPVSVMGVTVMEPTQKGWLVGSFNGLYYWNRKQDIVLDCYTGQPAMGISRGRPVSSNPISGYSNDFDGQIIFEYNRGAIVFDSNNTFPPMPEEMGAGQISLYHAALEVHTGRAYCYLFGLSGDLYIFLFGLLILILLISGYIVYHKKYIKKRNKKNHTSCNYSAPIF